MYRRVSTADRQDPHVISALYTAHGGAPDLPAAAPRNRQHALPPTVQRALQPRLYHRAQVTAGGGAGGRDVVRPRLPVTPA